MYKIISEKIDKTSGYCKVIIQTKEGKFTGISCCSPEDDFSPFAGINYAERRAVAAWCKRKAKIARIQLHTIQNLKKDLEIKYNGTFRQYPQNKVLRALKIKIRDYSNDIKYWTESAQTLEQSVYKDDEKRADILSRYAHTE